MLLIPISEPRGRQNPWAKVTIFFGIFALFQCIVALLPLVFIDAPVSPIIFSLDVPLMSWLHHLTVVDVDWFPLICLDLNLGVSWCTITHVTWCPFVSWAIWVIWIELSWHFSAIYVSWQISLHLFSSCAVVLYLILVLGCKVLFCVSICCNDRARWSWNNCNLCIKLGYYWAWALHPTIPRYQLRSVHINWSQSVSWVTGSNIEHFAFLTVQTSVVFLVHGISIPVRQRID